MVTIKFDNLPCRCYLSAFAWCGIHGEITEEIRKKALAEKAKKQNDGQKTRI